MASWKPEFIKKASKSWTKAFVFLKHAQPNVIPYRSSNSIFTIEPAKTRFKKWVHIDVYFTPKTAGEFTIELIISDTETLLQQPSIYRNQEDIAQGTDGVYRIGTFMPTRYGDFWWALKDNEGETIKFWRESGSNEDEIRLLIKGLPEREIWRPSSYKLPLPHIMDEAIAHVNRVLIERVFPNILLPSASS